MPRYPEDRKAEVLSKLLPPHNRTVPGSLKNSSRIEIHGFMSF